MPGDFLSSFVESLAGFFGISDEPARILITVFTSIPLAFLYRGFGTKLQVNLKHIGFITTGIFFYYFNFGFNVLHHIALVAVTYLIFKLQTNSWQRRTLIAVNLSFLMIYLSACYYLYETDDYDVNFTIPHCLLVLRLIALGFDILDGIKPCGPLSNDQSEAALSEVPSLLELYGFSFMTPAFLVGPIFGLKRYQKFIRGEFDDKSGFLKASFNSFMYGSLYILLRQIGSLLLPGVFFMAPCFKCASFMQKVIYVSLLGKVFLWKYTGIWLLSESALIAFGIAYGPTDEGVISDWGGCRNVNIRLFDLDGVRLNNYIQSMNIQTNKWASNYIYKRLKFLNCKPISFLITTIFLAVWHGFHSGYYLTFALEFFVINFEKEFEAVFNEVLAPRIPRVLRILGVFNYLFLRIYNVLVFGICAIPFIFLRFEDWSFVYCNISDVVQFVAYGYGIAFMLLIMMKIFKQFN